MLLFDGIYWLTSVPQYPPLVEDRGVCQDQGERPDKAKVSD